MPLSLRLVLSVLESIYELVGAIILLKSVVKLALFKAGFPFGCCWVNAPSHNMLFVHLSRMVGAHSAEFVIRSSFI